jgi:outer membrane protein OmpA-like peptidoglycan-associated protein
MKTRTMKKYIIILINFLLVTTGYGQEIQWASKVLEFSSQAGEVTYSASQILDKPNSMQENEDNQISPNSWVPKGTTKLEFIKVSFERPEPIQQVAIAESFNPSALTHIFAYDENDGEHLLMSFEPKKVPLKARLFRTYFDLTNYNVQSLKLVFDTRAVEGQFAVDAIGVSGSKIPISISINTAEIADNFTPVRLSDSVNTQYPELKPLISPDAKTLYFSRRNHPENIGGVKDEEDIWYSELDESTKEWKKAKNIGAPLNNSGPNFISSITPDGNSVLVLLGNEYKKNRMTAGLSVSTKTSEGWTAPAPLAIEKNYNYSDKANFFLANNRSVMLMSVERDDTKGNRDLYVSFLKKDNSWSEPLNLGNIVNTADEEAAPFLALDDKTLFFSSKGFMGFGGYDIYMTRRLDDSWTNWTEPENLGSTLNSTEDDIFFNLSIADEYAYFSRGNLDNVDIYRVQLPFYHQPDMIVTVKGKVYNAETMEVLSARIEYERLRDGEKIGFTTSDSLTGAYQIILPAGENYGYYAQKKGFLPISANIDLTEITSSATIEQDLYLVPVKTSNPIVLNNIFFKFDSDELIPTSFPELNRLTEFLLDYQDANIRIAGHTCSMGSDDYNQRLSERRAKAIVRYMVNKGVGEERLIGVGFGEVSPIVSNETEEGRRRNRRVEFNFIQGPLDTTAQKE